MSENRMETYFNIRYEFDRERVFRRMDEVLRSGGAGYICVADGHVLPRYSATGNTGMC